MHLVSLTFSSVHVNWYTYLYVGVAGAVIMSKCYAPPPHDVRQPTDQMSAVGAPLPTNHTSYVDWRTLAGCRLHTERRQKWAPTTRRCAAVWLSQRHPQSTVWGDSELRDAASCTYSRTLQAYSDPVRQIASFPSHLRRPSHSYLSEFVFANFPTPITKNFVLHVQSNTAIFYLLVQ